MKNCHKEGEEDKVEENYGSLFSIEDQMSDAAEAFNYLMLHLSNKKFQKFNNYDLIVDHYARYSLGDFVKLFGGVRRPVSIWMPLLHLRLVRRLDLLDGGPAMHAEHAVRLELDGERGRSEGEED